jgi:hypothetical protein
MRLAALTLAALVVAPAQAQTDRSKTVRWTTVIAQTAARAD